MGPNTNTPTKGCSWGMSLLLEVALLKTSLSEFMMWVQCVSQWRQRTVPDLQVSIGFRTSKPSMVKSIKKPCLGIVRVLSCLDDLLDWAYCCLTYQRTWQMNLGTFRKWTDKSNKSNNWYSLLFSIITYCNSSVHNLRSKPIPLLNTLQTP